jgi:hypothetical protein
MHAKRIGEYLDASPGGDRLTSHAACLISLRRVLAEALPEPLRRSCAIANYKQGKVILIADNSAAAARLRLLAPSLLQLLGQRGLEVTGMKVEVQPDARRRTQPVEEKSLLLSSSASQVDQGPEKRPSRRKSCNVLDQLESHFSSTIRTTKT